MSSLARVSEIERLKLKQWNVWVSPSLALCGERAIVGLMLDIGILPVPLPEGCPCNCSQSFAGVPIATHDLTCPFSRGVVVISSLL
jgi:hypothetical protein